MVEGLPGWYGGLENMIFLSGYKKKKKIFCPHTRNFGWMDFAHSLQV